MTQQQIRNYFGAHLIYLFDGTPQELLDLTTSYSINYIVAEYKTYFICDQTPPADSRITLFADNTQGAV